MDIKFLLTALVLMVSGAAAIATDPYHACSCPNNCSHKVGSSCKFRGGPSGNSPVLSGKCESFGGGLTCIAQ
ncbi:hypothetical protein E4U43_000184 [Claviceps pusilla]|uniref:Uncharacterized protein n=1 Tax=Claviceps pusilla TaxID=123648 RepID=A0A9P7SZA8_9HYPO|nr:hypothetical protein E4U43_000184 [Claviceps pusilla]